MSQELNLCPNQVSKLFGHKNVVQQIRKLYHNDTLSHSIIFTGCKGVGKATAAYNLSRAILNRNIDLFGADEITSFSNNDALIFANSHPDCLSISRQTAQGALSKDIPLDHVKKIVKFFNQTSVNNNWRIAIIDSVDDLAIAGANSLLKILEEPPNKCLLLLISHNIYNVLPTIRSRCQVISFDSLSSDQTMDVLKSQEVAVDNISYLSNIANITPGLLLAAIKLGGDEFYRDFLAIVSDSRESKFTGLYSFYNNYLLNSESPMMAWEWFCDFLQFWISHNIILNCKTAKINELNWLFNSDNNEILIKNWFAIQGIINDCHVFNLDKKHTFLVIMHKLLGVAYTSVKR